MFVPALLGCISEGDRLEEAVNNMKKILIILDGAADLPVDIFWGKTPLEAAGMPNLDFFVQKGKIGSMYPINENTIPSSDNSLISIFGNNSELSKRGIFEALGLGMKLKKGDLALRTNFGTIDNLKSKKVIDRRAGRTLTTSEAKALAKELNEKIKLPCKFEFRPAVQHRGVVVFRGKFSDNVSNTDPEWAFNKEFKFSEPLDNDENSKKTVDIINEFIDQAFRILNHHHVNLSRIKKGLLPANMLFMRGGGIESPKLKKYKNWMSINPMPLEIGISKLSGMKVFSFSYPELKTMDSYENLYEGLNKTIQFAIKNIKKHASHYSGCYIQFKETDVPGHDNKPYEKKKMLELIDKKFFSFLKSFVNGKDIEVVLTCDHSTPCKLKRHSKDPVPVLVYDGKGYDASKHFCESEARTGSLGKFYGGEFMEKTGLN